MRDPLAVPAGAVEAALGGSPPVEAAIVLGSGQSAAVSLAAEREVPYANIPGAPRVTAVAGHAASLAIGAAAGTRVALFRGRFHLYQGISAPDAAFPARLAAALGARTLILTNAAGSLTPELPPGTLALITDHIGLLVDSPLDGWSGGERGGPFVAMRDAYDPGLRALAREAGDAFGIRLGEGVYAAVRGPGYETPAEVRALRALGADLVGMSTIPEAVAARALGMRVLGISVVANAAGEGLSHDEVLAAAGSSSARLERLTAGILERL
ncbi:MAG: purine-nucleoside phosphorylase [Coriobacteriia bacterium]|nr:purine-nucleoside phosphorylase [Coriobacteriia bacterium]